MDGKAGPEMKEIGVLAKILFLHNVTKKLDTDQNLILGTWYLAKFFGETCT
jgi:hypothetical protein